jgi:hypothetical protein
MMGHRDEAVVVMVEEVSLHESLETGGMTQHEVAHGESQGMEESVGLSFIGFPTGRVSSHRTGWFE